MPTCPKCHKLCKTTQGLGGHMRFRHQTTIPRHDLPLYTRDRLERVENENAKLREQLAGVQRQLQDRETFFQKLLAEQKSGSDKTLERTLKEQLTSITQQHELEKLQWEIAAERKVSEQRGMVLKLQEELRVERQTAQEREAAEQQRSALLKRQYEEKIAALQRKIQALEQSMWQSATQQGQPAGSEATNTQSDQREAGESTRRSLLLPPRHPPPLLDPLHPSKSLTHLRHWMFGRQ